MVRGLLALAIYYNQLTLSSKRWVKEGRRLRLYLSCKTTTP
jgi:hypothetical protein